jgi:hypothetical protein
MQELLVFTTGERRPYNVKERSKGNFKNDPNDITKQWNDLLKEMSYKYDEDLMKERSCKEALLFTAGEKGGEPYHLRERSEVNFKNGLNDIMKLLKCVAKEIKTNNEIQLEEYTFLKDSLMSIREDIKNCTESIKLKRNESDNNSESGTVREVVSSSAKPDQSENTENVINAQDRGTHKDLNTDHDLKDKLGGLNEAANMDVKETGNVSNAVNLGTMLQEKENMIEELKAKLEESQTAFKELKESQINERILTKEFDIMRSELRELRTNNSKLLSRAEYNEERVKVLSANIRIYK